MKVAVPSKSTAIALPAKLFWNVASFSNCADEAPVRRHIRKRISKKPSASPTAEARAQQRAPAVAPRNSTENSAKKHRPNRGGSMTH